MTAISGGGRPAKYVLADGKRVPGVTTITGRFKDSGGLIHWAWSCGKDGLDYREKRDEAADVGHSAHAVIDAIVHGINAPEVPEAHRDAVDNAASAFKSWRDATRVEFIETEVPLVSERHRFGGTFDWLLRIDGGALALGDLKSGNKVYPEMLAQMGGYDVLLEERGQRVENVILLRVGKEHGDFHAHNWPRSVLDLGREMFLGMRRLYDLDAQLKKAVG